MECISPVTLQWGRCPPSMKTRSFTRSRKWACQWQTGDLMNHLQRGTTTAGPKYGLWFDNDSGSDVWIYYWKFFFRQDFFRETEKGLMTHFWNSYYYQSIPKVRRQRTIFSVYISESVSEEASFISLFTSKKSFITSTLSGIKSKFYLGFKWCKIDL